MNQNTCSSYCKRWLYQNMERFQTTAIYEYKCVYDGLFMFLFLV